MRLNGPIEFTEEFLRIVLISVDRPGAFPFTKPFGFPHHIGDRGESNER